jgi:hypothetical protein
MGKQPTIGRSPKQLNMLLAIEGGSTKATINLSSNAPSDSELRERIFEQLKLSGLTRNSAS